MVTVGGAAGVLGPAVAGALGAEERRAPHAAVLSSIGAALSLVRAEAAGVALREIPALATKADARAQIADGCRKGESVFGGRPQDVKGQPGRGFGPDAGQLAQLLNQPGDRARAAAGPHLHTAGRAATEGTAAAKQAGRKGKPPADACNLFLGQLPRALERHVDGTHHKVFEHLLVLGRQKT